MSIQEDPSLALFENLFEDCRHVNPEKLAELTIALRAFQSHVGSRALFGYSTIPVTTGLQLNAMLDKHGVNDVDGLIRVAGPDALKRLVIQPNIDKGRQLAERLSGESGLVFISPALFNAVRVEGWDEPTFMTMWYKVMFQRVSRHTVADGWQFSTGSSKEVQLSCLMHWQHVRADNLATIAQAFRLDPEPLESEASKLSLLGWLQRMKIFDERGQFVWVDQAFAQSVAAIRYQKERGRDYSRLLPVAETLRRIPLLSPIRKSHAEFDLPDPFTEQYREAEAELAAITSK